MIPERFWKHSSCKLVEERFGIPPKFQILDDNYHHQLILKLGNQMKRGRPDVVHFALLDLTSTPAFLENLIDVYIHTLNNTTVKILPGARPPRTLQRFCGVMSKVLSGRSEDAESQLFEISNEQPIKKLVDNIDSDRVVSLSTEGVLSDLTTFLRRTYENVERVTWIMGGFARGHFGEEVKIISSDMISISKYSLAAHVVAARLCFGIEKELKFGQS